MFSIVQGLDRTQDQTVNASAVFSASQGNIENMEYERNENEYYNCAVVCDEDPTIRKRRLSIFRTALLKDNLRQGSSAYDDTENGRVVCDGSERIHRRWIYCTHGWSKWTTGLRAVSFVVYFIEDLLRAGSTGDIVLSDDGINWTKYESGSSSR